MKKKIKMITLGIILVGMMTACAGSGGYINIHPSAPEPIMAPAQNSK